MVATQFTENMQRPKKGELHVRLEAAVPLERHGKAASIPMIEVEWKKKNDKNIKGSCWATAASEPT